MKKVTLLIAMAALVIFAGCKKDKEITGTTLKASIEQHESDDSKTSLNPTSGAISWMAGDKITVCNGTTTATFRLTSGEGSTNGSFTYNGDFDINDNTKALYPETGVLTDNSVTFTVPQQQNVAEPGTFANGANPMLGLNSGDGFVFGSICGCLGLKLTGNNVDITAIEIVSENEALAGTITGHFNNSGSETANGSNSVRLNCTTTLTAEEKEFFIVLLPGTLGSGFTLNIYNGDELIFTKTTTTNLIMLPNKVKVMNPLNVESTPAESVIDLSTLTDNYEAQDGDILTGTLGGFYRISIADGATVTLNGVTINQTGSWGVPNHPGINCQGDVTIILADGSTNTVRPFRDRNPAIYIASGKTLTIKGGELGTGSLTATNPYQYGAGIGSCGSNGYTNNACGNIVIEGGNITAQGGSYGAGIGAGSNGCGNITITGGTVTASSSSRGAGIGGGGGASCGNITIENTVTLVTATKGSSAIHSIGRGYASSCGTVTIGGIVYWDGSAYQNGGDTYLPTSPLVYPAPTPAEATVTWINSHIQTISLGNGEGEIYKGVGVQLDDEMFEESFWDGTEIYLKEMAMLTFQIDSDGDYAEYEIKKVEIYYSSFSGNLPEGEGWSNDESESKLTWEDVSASVMLWHEGYDPDHMSITVTQIVFTLEKSAK